ncbi:MAG: cobalamin-binding protein [Rhodospirillales bacterium]|nr:MAG: cobalamin-binding protein [Rhodospirillales bacterium]
MTTAPAGGAAGVRPKGDAVIDDAGVAHQPVTGEPRIVSLVPSITELLFDLGLGPAVVGRTAFCVHPAPMVRSAKSIGGTKQVNMAKLAALAPTHAIVNVDENPRGLAEELAARGITVVVTHPIEVADNLRLYRLMGAMFRREAQAAALSRRFEAAYDELMRRRPAGHRERVLYLIWRDPWMTVSRETYIARMLALIGWDTVADAAADRYPRIEVDEACLRRCDRVLFASEPFPFKECHLAAFREAFPGHADKARLIDGERISWYGSRAVAGLHYLSELAGTGK